MISYSPILSYPSHVYRTRRVIYNELAKDIYRILVTFSVRSDHELCETIFENQRIPLQGVTVGELVGVTALASLSVFQEPCNHHYENIKQTPHAADSCLPAYNSVDHVNIVVFSSITSYN